MFAKTSSLGWNDVLALAESFVERIRAVWPEFYEEMEGTPTSLYVCPILRGWESEGELKVTCM
jgi:hypothetical protein